MSYATEFGGQTRDDTLYDAVSEKRRYPGMEHWLPMFVEKLETLFDYLGGLPPNMCFWVDHDEMDDEETFGDGRAIGNGGNVCRNEGISTRKWIRHVVLTLTVTVSFGMAIKIYIL